MTARAALVSAVLLVAGCGDSADPQRAAPTPAIGTDEHSIEVVEDRLSELARRKEAARRAGDTEAAEELEQAIKKLEAAQDAAVEAEFASDTAYENALDRLPLHEPPLHVAQLVVDDSHELVVRVRSKRFCGWTQKQRLTAVRAYYEAARKEMEAGGVTDFAMVVDGLRETNAIKPLARASGGKVALTARGRRTAPC